MHMRTIIAIIAATVMVLVGCTTKDPRCGEGLAIRSADGQVVSQLPEKWNPELNCCVYDGTRYAMAPYCVPK